MGYTWAGMARRRYLGDRLPPLTVPINTTEIQRTKKARVKPVGEPIGE
ncbi:MAG: hypothetical protein HC881_19775 [Leptolyngbyaceae cyanobacterium SL_7_1]|nr:hypothetical protein [Leptolyngbyaceae cyanobacterium SL_7_1]